MRPRVLAMVVPVCAGGFAVVSAAAVAFATMPRSAATLAGVAVFVVASAVADRFPVPLDEFDSGGVSLAFVFGVAGVVLFGWAAGLFVFVAAPAITQTLERRPRVRVAYNVSVLALGAATAGALAAAVRADSSADLIARVGFAGFAQYTLNLVLVTAVIAASAGTGLARLIRATVRATLLPFALMASAALMLVVLWQRSPILSVSLFGPLLAIQLYQRAIVRALRAMRLAMTDPLTGLGNHRHFRERLGRTLRRAQETGMPLAVCLLDVDDFKRINDNHGHLAGDRVLAQLGATLRLGSEAFRLGGDEFALLLPGYDETAARRAADSVVTRIAALELEHGEMVTVSGGIAAFPAHAAAGEELVQLADSALYSAKARGKNRVCAHQLERLDESPLADLAGGDDPIASLTAALSAHDAYTAGHSRRVAELAGRMAARLGLRADELDRTRLAAFLHDVGKLAVPEDILCKPGPLTPLERLVVERHAQVGFALLGTLGIAPVAELVRHHHERWDGGGYPDELPGDKIPLGARIIFVADAYDAMTSERVYRAALSPDEALDELERCAGTQFDPSAVAALVAVSREGEDERDVLAAAG